MAQTSVGYHNKLSNWTYITLFGDQSVGRRSIPRRYIHGDPPAGPGGPVYWQKSYTLTSLPLGSSPLLKLDRDKVRARTPATPSDHNPEMVEMMIYFCRVSNLDFKFFNAVYMEYLLARTDAIVLCYDCSRPETLHNVIYEVS
jgi:hypothetical protein